MDMNRDGVLRHSRIMQGYQKYGPIGLVAGDP